MTSTFKSDLSKEKKLANFLDATYYKDKITFPKNFSIERIYDNNLQHKGVDIIIKDSKNNLEFYIDEKAQLDFINKKLPTFAFELSYLKNEILKNGWLFDKSKITNQYFLMTCIETVNNEFKSCRLLSVDRFKLHIFLKKKNLTQEILRNYENDLRRKNEFGKHYIKELLKNEGSLNYTEHKAEKPINIVMQIQCLLDNNICIELKPCQLI